MDDFRSKVEKLYVKYADDYNSEFIKPTFNTFRSALSFCNDIHIYYLKKYLTQKEKNIKIADIGGGDGMWSEFLLNYGFSHITLTDISQNMLEIAKKRLNSIIKPKNIPLSHLNFIKADICAMPQIPSNKFDVTISLYDPVSYSLQPKQAVQELSRITKSGGLIFISLDTKYRRVPELIEAGQLDKVEELLQTSISYDFQHPQYNVVWEEMEAIFRAVGVQVLEFIGAPVFVHQVKPKILRELEKQSNIRDRLLEIELEYGTNRSLINNAGHLICIGRKNL
ncbi:MAG: class I SAM-dependent methyltransferase [Promethearchaeota archaeon]